MNGKRAKMLRKASYFNIDTWRKHDNVDKYKVEMHTPTKGTLYCRGQRMLYQLLKKGLKQ
jgi:hypothetical protein